MPSLQDLKNSEQCIHRLTPVATTCRPVGTKVSAIGLAALTTGVAEPLDEVTPDIARITSKLNG